jgi:uncharacterized LabA/DUF88 family protein
MIRLQGRNLVKVTCERSSIVRRFPANLCGGLIFANFRQFSDASKNSSAGIFLDAENLLQFLKEGGGRKLVESAVEFGNPIVRRAYGNWSLPSLNIHQRQLVENGFQLIHTPHPIPKKNAADIAMVVDVMDTLHRMRDLQCFVLATGDSDFSHLFCHLRQAGRTVVGIGPRSTLSEMVKNSTDRYIYIDGPSYTHPPPLAPAPAGPTPAAEGDPDPPRPARERDALREADFARAVELLERALDALPPDAAVNPSQVKDNMLRLDSSFDHRAAGFSSFTAFLQASGRVHFRRAAQAKDNGNRLVCRRPAAPAAENPLPLADLVDAALAHARA